MARDQVSYNTWTSQKLQHATTKPGVGAATLPTSASRSDIPTSSNIHNTVVGFPLYHLRKRPDRLSSYQFSCATVRSVQSSITIGWLVVNNTQSLLTIWWQLYGLSSRSTPAEVVVVDSQGEVIQTRKLYVEPTSLLRAMRIFHMGGE